MSELIPLFKVGDVVRVRPGVPNENSHNWRTGIDYVIKSVHVRPHRVEYRGRAVGESTDVNYAWEDVLMRNLTTRVEVAERIKTELLPAAEERVKEAQAYVVKLNTTITRLETYDSENSEKAALLASVLASEGDAKAIKTTLDEIGALAHLDEDPSAILSRL